MPNSFAALALAAVMSTSTPGLVQTCAATLSSDQQVSLLVSPQKQKDKNRRYLAIDTKCPVEKGNGVLEIFKKNFMGDIVVVQSAYKDNQMQTLIIDWGPSAKGFTRPVDLKRGEYPSRAQRRFFVNAMKSLDALNKKVCQGDDAVRAEYFDKLKDNRRAFDAPAAAPQTARR